ncbi:MULTISPECIES: hypothetical protein [Methylomonas]|jgi:hypothetical protein|uniref:Lipoprotein n=1 Tax=Methylomonas methanica TaxID=421 RepID=A0A177LY53_METMH|nr:MULTISPECIES: hypothetical protein [Methylomonas]OAH97892.1 hypothetical protein A1332_21260 [Methylomonas methanica]OAI01526.1 hypothetical protein A1353_17870 [Methylomonas methanica]
MKKMLVIVGVLVLSGCSEKEEYQSVVLEQMKQDKDIKDYGIEPETMTKCVVDTSSNDMPGLFLLDPERRKAYKNYAKMLDLNKSKDPQKTLTELRESFGAAKELAEAHSNYVESVVECMSGLVTGGEEKLKNAK